MTVKAYLAPGDIQNLHGVDHNYQPGQDRHRVGRALVGGTGTVMFTGDPDAQQIIERHGLEPLAEDVTEAAFEAFQNGDFEQADSIAADVADGESNSGGGDGDDDDDENESDEPYPILDSTITNIETRLESGDFDDELDDLDEAEDNGRDRVGVRSAIEDRREAISEPQPHGSDGEGGDNDE